MPTPHRFAPLVAAASLLAAPFPLLAQSMDSLWERNCLACHGNRGQGGGAGTSSLLREELRDPARGEEIDRRFFDALTKGLPEKGMVSFASTLTPEQRWGLVVHIRELQHRETRRLLPKIPEKAGVYSTRHHSYTIERVIDSGAGLEVPWSVDFLPDGRMLVADRPGRLRIHSTGRPGGSLSAPVKDVPEVRNQGQGGLMEAAVHPDFASNGWVYLAYADAKTINSKRAGMTKLVRGVLRPGPTPDSPYTFADQLTIFEAKPEHYLNTDLHFGCRIVFADNPADPSKKFLYFAIGERGRMEMAQDLTRPNGKVHRVHDDGSIPPDNPYLNIPDAYPSIWSFGHRNPQGLAFDSRGNLWDTEHGPRGGDEVNLVERAHNYGWPIVSFGMNYDGSAFRTPWIDSPASTPVRAQTTPSADSNITMPVFRWLPSIGACGLDVAKPNAMFSKWADDLLAGGLSGENVDRIRIRSDSPGTFRVTELETIFLAMGRVRDVVCAPDASVYVVLNDPDIVVRLVESPAN